MIGPVIGPPFGVSLFQSAFHLAISVGLLHGIIRILIAEGDECGVDRLDGIGLAAERVGAGRAAFGPWEASRSLLQGLANLALAVTERIGSPEHALSEEAVLAPRERKSRLTKGMNG
jgi:hypothetical protein